MRYLKIVALFAAMNMSAWIIPQEVSAQQGSVSFGVFYNELSPYGQWVDYPDYGYVWIPSTGPDFAPYATNGYWVWTDYGWTWVSGYRWGWAPFHYGRWDYDDHYGWFWIPDNEWGPAWVSWRRSPGYYGWAPMRPGTSISVSFGSGYTVPNDRWRFVRDRDFSRRDINRYYINRNKNITIIKNSSVIDRTYTDQNRHSTYVSGPDRADVQKITGRPIRPVVINDNEKPGQILKNNRLQIYRPQVQMNDENGRRPAPSRVVNLNDVKRPTERNAANPIPKVTPAINSRQKAHPTGSVNSPDKSQPVQMQDVKSSDNRGKEKQLQKVTQPSNGQSSRSRNVKTPKIRGNTRQPQKAVQRKDNIEPRSSQRRTDEGEKEQRNRR
jgi:hypothetical protein